MNVKEFVSSLVAEFPGLRLVLDTHIKDFDEILPHVFMGDVRRFAVARVTDGEAGKDEVKRLLAFLNRVFEVADEPLQNLICVSFLENIVEPNETGSEILGMLSGVLAREYKIMREWKPPSKEIEL